MRRVLLSGLLVILLLIGIAGCSEDESAAPERKFKVERIIDGDTVVLVDGRTVRYIGINTPERGEPYYEEAKEANRRLVDGKEVKLGFDEEEKDRYERTLAYVYVGDTFVNAQLVREGYARAYPYPPNTKYQETFSRAQEEARQQGLGIWSSRPQGREIEITAVNSDALGNDRENLNGEWVTIASNTDVPVDMTGFTLSDDGNHVYEFGDFTLSAEGTVTVLTGSGTDTSASLYWGSKTPIWNNDGDTAYLKDANGIVVDEYSY